MATDQITVFDAVGAQGTKVDTDLMRAMDGYMTRKGKNNSVISISELQGYVYALNGATVQTATADTLMIPVAQAEYNYFTFAEIQDLCSKDFGQKGTFVPSLTMYIPNYKTAVPAGAIAVTKTTEVAMRLNKRDSNGNVVPGVQKNARLVPKLATWLTDGAAKSGINPFGRFSSDKVVVVSAADTIAKAVIQKYNLNNQSLEHSTTDTYQNNNQYHCLLEYAGIKVYQYFPNGVPAVPVGGLDGIDGLNRSAPPTDAPNAFSTDFAILNAKATKYHTQPATRSTIFKDEREDTSKIMKYPSSTDNELKDGVSAGKFSKTIKQSATYNEYEWLHRHAHSLGGADAPENLMLGTTHSNSFNMIDERIVGALCDIDSKRSTYLRKSGKQPQVGNKPAIETIIDLGPGITNRNPVGIWNTVPTRMDYTIHFDGKLHYSRKNMSLYYTWKPSKWVNAIIDAICEEEKNTILTPLQNLAKNAPKKKKTKGVSFIALRQTMLGSVPVPTIDKAFMSTLLGIAEQDITTDVVSMDSDQLTDFYNQACADDPDAASVFPDPSDGVHDNERIVTFKCIVKLIECRVRSMMTFEQDGTVSHLTGLYLSTESERAKKSLISSLFDMERQHLVLNKYKDMEPSPIVAAAVLDVSKMFSFVPNMPQNIKLELSGKFGSATRFDDISVDSGTLALTADLTGNIHLSGDVSLTDVTAAVTIIDQLDMSTGGSNRIYNPSLQATVNFADYDTANPCCFKAQVMKDSASNSVTICGNLAGWSNPFGIPDVTFDTASLSLKLQNGDISAKVTASIDLNDGLGIDFVGSWNKADGVGLFAEMEGVLNMSHIQDIHTAVTKSDIQANIGYAPPDATVENVRVSFCSKTSKTFLGTHCPIGFCVHGTFKYEDITADVTITISAEGVKFEGTIYEFKVIDELTVEVIDVLMLLSTSSDTQSFLQGSGAFTVDELDGFKVEVLARLGKDRAAYAEIDHLGFDASKINPALSWLSFSFPQLAYSYTDKSKKEGLDIQLPTTSKDNKVILKPVHLDPGQVLSGSISFGLVKTLLGQDMTLGFSYHFLGEKFNFVPVKPDGTLKAPRIQPADGVSILIELDDFKILKMGIECVVAVPSLHIDEIKLDTGFKVVKGSPGFSVSLYGEITVEGKGLKIADDIYMISADISADILPVPGDIKFGGVIMYMDNEVDACLQIAEDPDRDGFVLSLHHEETVQPLSFSDLIEFIPKLVGIHLPTIPFLDEIKVNLMWAYFGGVLGISYETKDGTKVFPSGFGFDIDLTAFGARFAAMLEVSETRVAMSLDIPKISLADGAFAIAGYDGRNGPHFDMDFSPTKAEMNVDGSFKFLLLEVRALIHLRVAADGKDIFDLDFQWKLLGLETDIHIHYKKEPFSLVASFYLGDDHKKKANEAVLNKIKAAAKKMKEDALAVEQASAAAVQAFTKGLEQLQNELQDAKEAEDKFAGGMRTEIEGDLADLHNNEAQAKSDYEALEKAQKGQVGELKKALDKTVSDLHSQIQDAIHRKALKDAAIKSESDAWKQSKANWSANFKTSSDAAKAKLATATKALADEQQHLTDIENQDPPSGKGSDDDKKKYNDAKAAAQRAVNASNAEIHRLNNQITAISNSETNKLAALDKIHEDDSGELEKDQQRLQALIVKLQGDLTRLEADQITLKDELHTLSDLETKKHAIENGYNVTVTQKERVYNTEESKHTMHKKRITLDQDAVNAQVARMNQIVSTNNGRVDPAPPTQGDIDTAINRVWDRIEGLSQCPVGYPSSFNDEVYDTIREASTAYSQLMGSERNAAVQSVVNNTNYPGVADLVQANRDLNGILSSFDEMYPYMLQMIAPWMTAPDGKLNSMGSKDSCFQLLNNLMEPSYWSPLFPADWNGCSKDDLKTCLQELGKRLNYLHKMKDGFEADDKKYHTIPGVCYNKFLACRESTKDDIGPVFDKFVQAVRDASSDPQVASIFQTVAMGSPDDYAATISNLQSADRTYSSYGNVLSGIHDGSLTNGITTLTALIGQINELLNVRFPPLQEAVQNVKNVLPQLTTLVNETHGARASIKHVFDEILLAIPRAALSDPTRSAIEVAVQLGIQKYKNVKGTAAASDALSRIMKYSDQLIPIDNRLQHLKDVMTDVLQSLSMDESLVTLIQKFIDEDSWSDLDIAAFEKEVSSVNSYIDMWASVVGGLVPDTVMLAAIRNTGPTEENPGAKNEQLALDNLRDALNDFSTAYASLDDETKALPFGPACDRVHTLLMKSHSLQKKGQLTDAACPSVAVADIVLVAPSCSLWPGYSELSVCENVTSKKASVGFIDKMTKSTRYHLMLQDSSKDITTYWHCKSYGHLSHVLADMNAAPHGSRAVLGVNGEDWEQTGDLRRVLSEWGSPSMGEYPKGKPMAFCGTKGARIGTGVLSAPLKDDEYRVSLNMSFPEAPDGTKTFTVEAADSATLWVNEIRGTKSFSEDGNLHFAVIDRITTDIIEEVCYDTSKYGFTSDGPTEFLEKQPDGQIVLMIAKNCTFGFTLLPTWVDAKFTDAMNKYGCGKVLGITSFIMCGIKGAAMGTVPQVQARYVGKSVLSFSFTPMADRVNIIAEETIEGLDGYANRLTLMADDANQATDLLKNAFSNNMFSIMDVRSTLGDAVNTIHTALLVERNKELYDKKLHDKAIAVQKQLSAQGALVDEHKAYRSKEISSETSSLRAKAAADLQDINNQITAERNRIYATINDAAKVAADAITAEQKMEKVLAKEKIHVNEIQKHVAQGVQAAKDWQNPKNIPSTSSDRVKDAQTAVDKWNSSELAAHAAAAGRDALLAAKQAEAAAKLYEHMMKRNTMSFGHITASGNFSNNNCTFHIEVDLKFELHLDLGILGNIDISLPRVYFTLDIDLSFIIQLIENAFKLLWKAISNAFNRLF